MDDDDPVLPWLPSDVIISIDPGLMTGYCVWADGVLDVSRSGQMPWKDFELWLWELLVQLRSDGKSVHVQSERFTITARTVRTDVKYESLYVIGATDFMCRLLQFPHAMSSPEHVMRIFTDDALRALGLYIKGAPHQHDAARHLALVLLQRGIIDSRDMRRKGYEISDV